VVQADVLSILPDGNVSIRITRKNRVDFGVPARDGVDVEV
jgi:hypothetical protein